MRLSKKHILLAKSDVKRFKSIVNKTAKKAFKPQSPAGNYLRTLYMAHKNDYSQAKWLQILLLLEEMMEFVRDNFLDSSGKFRFPSIWNIFTVWKFIKRWGKDFWETVSSK